MCPVRSVAYVSGHSFNDLGRFRCWLVGDGNHIASAHRRFVALAVQFHEFANCDY